MLKNNIIVHKILPIIGLIFFILFTFSISCFAATNDLNCKDLDEDVSFKNFPFFDKPFMTYSSDGVFVYEGEIVEGYIYCPYVYFTGSRWEMSFCSYINDNGEIIVKDKRLQFNLYSYDKENFTYTISYTGDWCSFGGNTYEHVSYASPMCFIADGLGKVTSDNINNNVFFQRTPLQQTIQVVEITQVEEIPKAIIQVLKTIIPVGLVVLSIFLVIYLIRLVILRQM